MPQRRGDAPGDRRRPIATHTLELAQQLGGSARLLQPQPRALVGRARRRIGRRQERRVERLALVAGRRTQHQHEAIRNFRRGDVELGPARCRRVGQRVQAREDALTALDRVRRQRALPLIALRRQCGHARVAGRQTRLELEQRIDRCQRRQQRLVRRR